MAAAQAGSALRSTSRASAISTRRGALVAGDARRPAAGVGEPLPTAPTAGAERVTERGERDAR